MHHRKTTSAMYPNGNLPLRALRCRAQSGFTLLEILVVLFVLAIIASLAVPRVTAIYDAGEWRLERDEALSRLGSLGFIAFNRGSEIELTRYPDPGLKDIPFSLPEGWTLTTEVPVYYNFNGICSGGVVTLFSRGRTLKLELAPPFCRPDLNAS